ncbi:MAG: polysaccharide lyase family 7 protein, partial [Kiritimatiellales bacterium]
MRKCKWMKFSGRKGDWFSSQNPRCAARMSHPFLTGVCLGLLFAGTQADAVTNNVSSITALQSAISAASSNDVLILADGTYTNFTLTVSKSGITVRPATPGGAYLNDVQSIGITGNNITFSGFQFTSRTISTNGIIITVDGSRNLLTQLNFDGYQAEKYINLTSSGRSNEVSYCNFKNKPVTAQQGNLIHVALTAGSPGYHKIRYNSFQDMPGKGGDNGNECIRLENGSQSAFVGRTVVEFNYFNNTGMGDSEVISVKCRENVLRYNTMTNNQQGNFCFRNGDSNIAYGNFFINSGGIRVKEANDTYCYNNYFEKCGDGIVSAPVKYVYYTVNTTNVLRNINFFHNTFVGGTSIDFDAGATNNTWANNIFSNTSANIFTGSASGLNWAGNQYSGTLGISIPSGMTKTNSLLVRNSDGYYGLSSNSPAIDAASTNYPAILDIANVDDDPSLLLDISGQARLASAILKDVGCDEYGVNSTSNHPLALSDVGPSYRVSLSAPVSGASFAVPTSIAMTANVVASTGTITTVGFYNGSTLLGSDTTAPYTYTWTNVAVGSNNLTARATDKSGAVSTSAVVAVTVWAPPPGDNFDLSHWKLQLPISNGLLTGASGKVDEIEAADLVAGYTSDYFYTAANGAMALYAPNNGACTSGSDNPRSELREQLNPPANNSWSVYGTHIMTATLKVTQVSPDTGKVCIGQMKGGYKVDGSSATGTEHMIMFDLNSQKIYANINPDGDLNHSFSTNFITGSGVAVSNTITYTMSMVDGLLKFVVNNVTNSCDLLSGIEYHPGVFATNWDRASGNALYFKAGSYNQATNGLADQGARVEFSSLTTYHSANITNQPDSVTNAVGSEAGFTVGASGNGTLGYQWRFNGTNISGKTSATLTLNNVATNNAGNYTVVVSDNTSSFSAITSAVATLTVLTNTSTGVYFAVPGVTNWTCPSNVVSVQVECWGGGGAGGSASRPATTTQYGGGGAGGAYARYDSYPVTPGNTYYINVGAGGTNNSSSNNTTVAGGSSWFNTNNAPSTIIIAKGGAGGESAVGSTTNTGYGLGGIGTSDGSAGDVVWAGGSGASGAVNSAGGGGSSAGTATNGTSATNYVGATAPAGGGNGGTGSTGTSSLSGGKGSPFGGAGAGALANSATLRAGGTGSVGRVVLTFSTNTFNAAPRVTLTAPTNNASFTAP